VYGDAWFGLAQSAYELGEYDLSVSCLDEAEKYGRNKTAVHNLRGFALIALGKLPEAEAVFKGVLAAYPNDITSRFGLGELNIFYGRLTGAESLFQDALKRDTANRRALLSLALIASELGKNAAADQYISQALRFHSGDGEVHYFAAYLAARGGNLPEAERYARIALQFRPNHDKSYELLGGILFKEGKYQEALDICDFMLGRNRMSKAAWYSRALSLQNLGRVEEAVQAFDTLLAIDGTDEIARSALEILVSDSITIEDPRRAGWARYHIAKAEEAQRAYLSAAAHYEFRRALRMDPQNPRARSQYAKLLLDEGYPANFLSHIEFAARFGQLSTGEKDSVEAYRSILSDTLGAQWKVDPFYLDKERWRLAIFYAKDDMQLLHEEAAQITAKTAAAYFAGVPAVRVTAAGEFSSFADSFRQARDSGQDYFALLSFEENERELALSATIYSGKTGAEAAGIRVYRTGNDRFASAIRAFGSELLALFPQRGKIIARQGNRVLMDLGKIDGIAPEGSFTVIKKDRLLAADRGFGVKYSPEDVLGVITVTRADEDVSEGTLGKTGFYDRVNVGDEVIPLPPPGDAPEEAKPASPPRRGFLGLGKREDAPQGDGEKLLPAGVNALKPPALAELIRGIR
jgi:tetratricopeptide (TPR) repeat protein